VPGPPQNIAAAAYDDIAAWALDTPDLAPPSPLPPVPVPNVPQFGSRHNGATPGASLPAASRSADEKPHAVRRRDASASSFGFSADGLIAHPWSYVRGEQVEKAMAASRRGDHEAAIALYRRAYESSSNELLLLALAEEFDQAGQPAVALSYFCRFLRKEPHSGHSTYATARVMTLRDDLGKPARSDGCADDSADDDGGSHPPRERSGTRCQPADQIDPFDQSCDGHACPPCKAGAATP
jgi:hypothetical protein